MLASQYVQRLLATVGLLSRPPPPDTPSSLRVPSPSLDTLVLFGGAAPWNTSSLTWTAIDDQVRGGSSTSYLTLLSGNLASFNGHLDTKTLGGAGFASQNTKPASNATDSEEGQEASTEYDDPLHWDLSSYSGIELWLGSGDTKTYTFTLKDAVPASKRSDGRERSGVSWEATFKVSNATNVDRVAGDPAATSTNPSGEAQSRVVYLPWSAFTATYRGREKKDAEPLQLDRLRRVGLLMRSFFEEQEGDFRLEIRRIAAVKRADEEQQAGMEL